MTLDEMISDIDYVVSKNQLAALELGDESTKQLLHWLEDYKRLKSDYIDIDKQLRTANTENCELKGLLRLAVDDFQTAMLEEKCKVCALEHCDYDEICKWRHRDETMELLGGADNAEN